MFSKIVKINNRQSYTSGKRAASYVARGLAERIANDEIRMLEAAELAMLRTIVREQETVKGAFAWYVGDSGGSKIMKDGTARGTRPGVSGGYRVLKAGRGE